MRFRYWVALIGLALAVVALAGWVALGRPGPDALLAALPIGGTAAPSKEGQPKLRIATEQVKQQAVPVSFDYTGTIISQADAELQARVTGIVTERPFEPGGSVAKDQVLFQIDRRPFEIALKSAEAQKTQAEANLAFAKAQVGRATALNKRGYETEQRAQQLVSQEATANASLQQAEAAIAREKLNLDYATIRAPFAGRVSLSLTNIGDTVIADQTKLASVVRIEPIDVQVALSAADAEAVHKALSKGTAKVILLSEDGLPERDATIYQLDNRFDPTTARRLVRALVPNKDAHYLPGQFVRARIEVGTQQKVLAPTIALSTQLDQQILYVIDGEGTVRVVPVEAGDPSGDNTAIDKGIEPGRDVAIDHLQRLREGMKVEASPAGTPPAGATRSAMAPSPLHP